MSPGQGTAVKLDGCGEDNQDVRGVVALGDPAAVFGELDCVLQPAIK